MMKVTLSVVAGQHRGQRMVAQHGLVTRFGQTEWADFSFPLDSSMAEFHFALDCREKRCVLQSLGAAPTWVNAAEVSQQLLMPGDAIRAGETEFIVSIEGMDESLLAAADDDESGDRGSTDPVAAIAIGMTAVEVCMRLELENDAPRLARDCSSSLELMQLLAAAGDYRQALRVRAFTLGRRPGIAWGCHLVQETFQDRISDIQQAGLAAAVAWTHSPVQENSLHAEAAAQRADYEGPGGMLAAAAFWSGDNIAPATSPQPVKPDDALASHAVAAALAIAIYHHRTPPIEEQFKHYTMVAAAIESGELKLYDT